MNKITQTKHGRTRDIRLEFWVTDHEKNMIRRRMYLSKTKNLSAYLRKMAIDGMILNVDTTAQKKLYEEMHKIGVNINQLAKLANTTGSATPDDIRLLKGMVNDLWHILKSFQLK